MKTLIQHGVVIPMTKENLAVVTDVGIDGKHIAFVGPAPKGWKADKTIDAAGCIVMPTLVNAHTHLSMELMRNYKDQAPNLMAWLNEIFPIEDKLSKEDILWASRLGVCELLQCGCTLFNDMYFEEEQTERAVNEGGMRASIGMTLVGDLTETKKRLSEKPKRFQEEMEKSDGRIHLAVAPHAIYTCSGETYQYAHDWAKEHGSLLHTHLSETKGEVEDCLKAHGKTPFDYLDSLGYFKDTKHLLAHGVHLTDGELCEMRGMNISVANNPTSNCKLASGMARVGKMLSMGINVCLGTDGSSSNNNQNMFEEMHVASLVSTALTGDIASLPPYKVLEMATINGAEALGFGDVIGTLEAGKEADLLILNTRNTHMTPLNDPFSALVYSAQSSDVDTVFCQGKLVLEKGKVLGIDENEAMQGTLRCWKDILSR